MAFVFIDPRRHSTRKRRIKKNAESQRVLDALDAYLEGGYQEPMKWLVRFWRDQAAVMTYQELRRLVTDEDDPEDLFNTWYQDYSKLLNEKMTPVWESAFMAGADSNPAMAGVQVDNSDVFVRNWITNHSGDLITSVTEDQVNAVRYIIAESKAVRMGSEETARYIRPTIGLTERQAQANLKHYTSVKEKLQEDHPRMRPENIERKARESAAKYAQKQQMYRAETISRTEIAQAYNQGNDTLIKQAMEQGLIPIQRKVWSTAMDGHVCEACESLEGTEIEMDGQFSATIGVRVKRTLTTALPPMHPRCKCAVMYESTGEYMNQDGLQDIPEKIELPNESSEKEPELPSNSATSYEGVPRSWNRIKDGDPAGLEVINPNYKAFLPLNASKEEKAYNNNCVNSVVAYDLRKRGWDVEARSYLECDLRRKAEQAWEGVISIPLKDNPRHTLEEEMLNWDESGRAFVGIDRPNLKHALVAEIHDKHLVLIDPQRNILYNDYKDIDDMLRGGKEYWRIDTLTVSQTGYNACKGR